MSYEYSEQYLPLGTYMTGPLIIGYYGALEEEKAWIRHVLWKIGELIPKSKEMYGTVGMEVLSRYMVGEPLQDLSGGTDDRDWYEVAWTEPARKPEEGFTEL
jgi:hypothetical protein